VRLPPIPRVSLHRLAKGENALPPEVEPVGVELAPPKSFAENRAEQAPPLLETLTCPNCDAAAPVAAASCPNCGFPFSCDLTLPSPQQKHRTEAWRVALAAVALISFLITGGLYRDNVSEYQGLTYKLVASLAPATDSGIPIAGNEAFVGRTSLALALLEQRTPEFYWRMQKSVAKIEYLSPEILRGPLGRAIKLEGIGAVATPSQRLVQVMPTTAFPDGNDAHDRAIFNYAATLVHELRHIELHWNGQSMGGWQEEVECEQAALSFLKQAGGPTSLIADKQLYLSEPTSRRYQRWYDWYKQFD
jgi:hypothetical protein